MRKENKGRKEGLILLSTCPIHESVSTTPAALPGLYSVGDICINTSVQLCTFVYCDSFLEPTSLLDGAVLSIAYLLNVSFPACKLCY